MVENKRFLVVTNFTVIMFMVDTYGVSRQFSHMYNVSGVYIVEPMLDF